MKKRTLFVLFCFLVCCLTLIVCAADSDEPVLNIYCQTLGHIVVEDKGYDATCLQPGKTDGSHCERCGMILEQQTPIPARAYACC